MWTSSDATQLLCKMTEKKTHTHTHIYIYIYIYITGSSTVGCQIESLE